ncbi:hypothetical protein AK830_g56 [Neonectria ditissima]|uniref:Uncharacterized protein n=1 Tax=Neonectria ditissima TaxID=78410 RepID=A0A0P7BWN8_9HYPO|nr:hypothetical protein AK830_g56 [Neonectria ditissima]
MVKRTPEERRLKLRQLQRFHHALQNNQGKIIQDGEKREALIKFIEKDASVLATARQFAPLVVNDKRVEDQKSWPSSWEIPGRLRTDWNHIVEWINDFKMSNPDCEAGSTPLDAEIQKLAIHEDAQASPVSKMKPPAAANSKTGPSQQSKGKAKASPGPSTKPAGWNIPPLSPQQASPSSQASKQTTKKVAGAPAVAVTARQTTGLARKGLGHPASRRRADQSHYPEHGPLFTPRAPKEVVVAVEEKTQDAGTSESEKVGSSAVPRRELSFDEPAAVVAAPDKPPTSSPATVFAASAAALTPAPNDVAATDKASTTASTPAVILAATDEISTPAPMPAIVFDATDKASVTPLAPAPIVETITPAPIVEAITANHSTANVAPTQQQAQLTEQDVVAGEPHNPRVKPSMDTIRAFYAWWAKDHNERYRGEHGLGEEDLSQSTQAFQKQAKARAEQNTTPDSCSLPDVVSPAQRLVVPEEPSYSVPNTRFPKPSGLSLDAHHVTNDGMTVEFVEQLQRNALVSATRNNQATQHLARSAAYPVLGDTHRATVVNNSVNNITNNYNFNPNAASAHPAPTPPQVLNTIGSPGQADSSDDSIPEPVVGGVLWFWRNILRFVRHLQLRVLAWYFFLVIACLVIVVCLFNAAVFCLIWAVGDGPAGEAIKSTFSLVLIIPSAVGAALSSAGGQPSSVPLPSATLSFTPVVPTIVTEVLPKAWDSWRQGVDQDTGQEDFKVSKDYAEAHRDFNRRFIDKMERISNNHYRQLFALKKNIAEAILAYDKALARPWRMLWSPSTKLSRSCERFQQRLGEIKKSITDSLQKGIDDMVELTGGKVENRGVCKSDKAGFGRVNGLSPNGQASSAAAGMICSSQKRTDQRWESIIEPIETTRQIQKLLRVGQMPKPPA